MKVNLMDYLYTYQGTESVSEYILPYCGYTLIENTNISDNAVPNPTITQLLTENPYSFTPQPNKTYAIIQQYSHSRTQILYPIGQHTYVTSTKAIDKFISLFYVPTNVLNAGMFINGIEYSVTSEDATKKMKANNSITIGNTVFKRTNSIVIWLDILDLLKANSRVEIRPFMITMDGIRIECYKYAFITVKDREDPSVILTTDVNSGYATNPNYPNFIEPQN